MLSEVGSYLERIEDLRGQVSEIIGDLPAEALNWRPFQDPGEPLTNSLAVLATHIAGAEHFWIAEVVGRRAPTRDRNAEFAARVSTAGDLLSLLERTGAETRQVLAALSAADLDGTREVRGRRIPVRWSVLHVIDHSALHLGHMQITYQLWAGGQGKPSPLWYQRPHKDQSP